MDKTFSARNEKTTNRIRDGRVFDAVNITLLVLIMILILYPLYFTIIASVSEPTEVINGNVILSPKGFTVIST